MIKEPKTQDVEEFRRFHSEDDDRRFDEDEAELDRDAVRAAIAADVEDFLKGGGVIERLSPEPDPEVRPAGGW